MSIILHNIYFYSDFIYDFYMKKIYQTHLQSNKTEILHIFKYQLKGQELISTWRKFVETYEYFENLQTI